MNRAFVLFAIALLFAACGTTPPALTDGGTDAGTLVQELDGGADAGQPVDAGWTPDANYVSPAEIVMRPYDSVVPVGYSPSTPTPLVVLLHGYTATATSQDAYFKLSQLAQTRTFLLALPNGTTDQGGQHFWNATDACCGWGSTVDDVGWLTAVIADMRAKFNVDPKRIFLVGHSNGGFMAHRMACERSETIAAIVSLAGAVWADPAKCTPTTPVGVLQVHGTIDAVIKYDGGSALVGQPPHPGAETTVATWAGKNGCTGTTRDPISKLDLVPLLLGNETDREAYAGCPANSAAELWRINGAGHIPSFNDEWAATLYNWLMAHPKP